MANLTPFQLLLWIAGLVMIVAPIIGIAVGVAMRSAYKAREQYILRLVTAFAKAGSATIESMIKGMEGKIKNGGSGTNKANDSNPNS